MGEDLTARLEAARARKAKAEASRVEPDPLLAEVEAAERDANDAEALTDAACKLGAEGRFWLPIRTDEGAIIVKRPDAVRYRRFTDLERPTHLDVENLCKPCVHHPDRSKLDAMLEARPGLIGPIAEAVGILAGARRADLVGKSGA